MIDVGDDGDVAEVGEAWNNEPLNRESSALYHAARQTAIDIPSRLALLPRWQMTPEVLKQPR